MGEHRKTGVGRIVPGIVAACMAMPVAWGAGNVAQAADAYTITYDAGLFGAIPGLVDDEGYPAQTATQAKPKGQTVTLLEDVPLTNTAAAVMMWQATVSANGGTFEDGSSTKLLTGTIGNGTTEFVQWAGSDGRAYYPGDAYSTDADLTLNARWHQYPRPSIPVLPVAKREGYELVGYYTQAEGGEFVANAGVMPLSQNCPETLYAHWRRGSSSTPSLSDVTAETHHVDDIRHVAALGITKGYPDGTFRPYSTVKRCDMAAFLFRMGVLWGAVDESWQPSSTDRARFSDVTDATPHAREIRWLGSTGISTGWEVGSRTEFRPYRDVARQDMAAFLFRLAKVSGRGWAISSYEPAYAVRSKFTDVDLAKADNHHDETLWLAEMRISEGFPLASASSGSTYELYPKALFKGGDAIKRCDMAAFLRRMGKLPSTSW